MTSTMTRRASVVGCLAAMVLTGCVPTGDDGPSPEPRESASTSTPVSASASASAVESVQQRWWSWAAAEATPTNPVADRTGAHCARNQPDDVWFFAGTFGGQVKRRCTVPAGRPIVAPLVNRVGSAPADCADFLKPASGEAVLDGTPLTAERMTGDPIVFTAAEDNPVTSDGGDYEGTACGLWVTIPPPAAGRHTLTIRGESGDFSVSVDYTFEVRARQ